MIFGPRHDMLELAQIPRERGALQALINEARQRRRKQRLMRFATANLVAWALFILFVWAPLHHPPTQANAGAEQQRVYLPFIVQEGT